MTPLLTVENVEKIILANRSPMTFDELKTHFDCGDKKGRVTRLQEIIDKLVDRAKIVRSKTQLAWQHIGYVPIDFSDMGVST